MFYHCEVIAGHALTIILFSNWIQYQKESEIILFQQPKIFNRGDYNFITMAVLVILAAIRWIPQTTATLWELVSMIAPAFSLL